jgi:hypothetical protein
MLKFIVIVTTTVGAMTGVGIWFTTTALAPRAIASMLRVFFWAWFAEWVVFLLEVIAILVFYFLWDRLGRENRRLRIRLGLVYVALSCTTAFIITGILGFMLTPGEWVTDPSLWNGFFNPTYWPQLATRLLLATVLGALLALMFAAFFSPRERRLQGELLRFCGMVLLIATPLMLVAATIYTLNVPTGFMGRTLFSVLTSRLSQTPEIFWVANGIAVAVLFAIAAAAFFTKLRATQVLLLPALLLFFGLVAEFERVREFIRGPYLMPGHMYVSSVVLEEEELFRETGMLPHSPWYAAGYDNGTEDNTGAFLFSANCSGCHTIGGINDIRARIDGRSIDGLYVIVGRTHDMISFMPPFSGNQEEQRLLARFLYRLGQGQVQMESLARHLPAAKEGTP